MLLSEGLHDLNALVVENPHAAALHLPLPDEADMLAYLTALSTTQFPDLDGEVRRADRDAGGAADRAEPRRRADGDRAGARERQADHLRVARPDQEGADRARVPGAARLRRIAVHAGSTSPAWSRSRRGCAKTRSCCKQRRAARAADGVPDLPGASAPARPSSSSAGPASSAFPCVVFKNFRDRWVGATESNLEKIFAILRALGQVVVFVDEADQAAGKREGGDGDSGLSGRVYSMLAKEMSDTRNRGRIIWVFATSRPDLLEVDLKRQGRLDVHIPLFPPETPAEREALLLAIARKLKFPLTAGDLPPFADDLAPRGERARRVSSSEHYEPMN